MLVAHFLIKTLGAVSVSGDGDSWDATFPVTGTRAVTADELLSAIKAERVATINAEARSRIEDKWPDFAQRNVALGIYPEAVATQMKDDIAAVITATNTASDLIAAATTKADAEAVTVMWPTI